MAADACAAPEERPYTLQLTREQLRVLSLAASVFSRLQAGHLDDAAIGALGYLPIDRLAAVRAAFEAAAEVVREHQELPSGARAGIGMEVVPDDARIAHDLHQVLRHRLAHERVPGGHSVNHDTPLPFGGEPLARLVAEGDP